MHERAADEEHRDAPLAMASAAAAAAPPHAPAASARGAVGKIRRAPAVDFSHGLLAEAPERPADHPHAIDPRDAAGKLRPERRQRVRRGVVARFGLKPATFFGRISLLSNAVAAQRVDNVRPVLVAERLDLPDNALLGVVEQRRPPNRVRFAGDARRHEQIDEARRMVEELGVLRVVHAEETAVEERGERVLEAVLARRMSVHGTSALVHVDERLRQPRRPPVGPMPWPPEPLAFWRWARIVFVPAVRALRWRRFRGADPRLARACRAACERGQRL